MTRPILYISGPYSPGNGRTVAENIAVARSYAVAAARKGWMPFTPHLNTAGFEVDCPEVPNEDWIDGDIAILRLLPRARAVCLPNMRGGGRMTGNGLAAPEWCLGCPDPIYDNRRGEWDWYCRQHSPTGIRCSNVAVLRERCYRVREYFAKKEAST